VDLRRKTTENEEGGAPMQMSRTTKLRTMLVGQEWSRRAVTWSSTRLWMM
jgi:hypothetical protein